MSQNNANNTQVAGEHYKKEIQHWDYVVAQNLDYFQGQITKYVSRWKDKGGVTDLKKAQHFLQKYIEVEEAKFQILDVRGEKRTQQPNPFGYDPGVEGFVTDEQKCTHPLAGVFTNPNLTRLGN